MSGETELKPCPNPDCDKSKGLLSRNTVIRGGRIPDHVVSCLTCGMSGPACSGPYQAMEGWNGLPRANPPGYELVPEGTVDVITALADFQAEYKRATRDLCPGSPYWAGKLLTIVQSARLIISASATHKETPNAQG